MKVVIDYHEQNATITGAIHPDGTEYVLKGLKKVLQDKAKEDGYYGLEFWHFAEYKYNREPGKFEFEILDPFHRI
jgi:hypothetical protein